MWNVYILECSDGTFYTGITNNLKRRVLEHNDSVLGAKYTRGRRPVKLIYSRKFKNMSDAAKEEWRIKKMDKTNKKSLVDSR
jgi:putative endonuclease